MLDFEQALLEQIEERESTLFEIEKVIFTKRYKLSQKHFNIFSLQSITMIYAVWEGFIQKSCQLYIEKINSLEIEFENLSDEIQVFHLENTFKQFKQYPEKKQKKVKFYAELAGFHQIDVHQIHGHINTQSNVSFENLNIILNTLSLEAFKETWGIYTHPKPNLKESLKTFLRYRNSVAHGGDISAEEKVTKEVYEKYRDLVRNLMYEIYERMQYGIKNKK
jgi:hypothetical protein